MCPRYLRGYAMATPGKHVSRMGHRPPPAFLPPNSFHISGNPYDTPQDNNGCYYYYYYKIAITRTDDQQPRE